MLIRQVFQQCLRIFRGLRTASILLASSCRATFSFIIFFAIVPTTAQAQDESAPATLPDQLVSLIANAYPLGAVTKNAYVLGRQLAAAEPAILFPAFGESVVEVEVELEALDEIVRTEDELGSDTQIGSTLKQLLADIEFGTRTLSASEQASYDAALALLYGDDGKPSSLYANYLDYERRYEELAVQLAAETNAAARASLQTRMRQIEQDWSLFGSRAEVQAALLQQRYLAPTDADAELRRFRQLVDEYHPPSLAALEQRLQQSDWLRVSGSSQELSGIEPVLSAGVLKVKLPPVVRISFDVSVVELSRVVLADPLITGTNWRLKSGLVLSDGNAAVDAPEELMPRVNSSAVVVKNLELLFASDLPMESASAVAKFRPATLDGMPIVTEQSAAVAMQRRTITVTGPMVVGVFVDDLIKSPNPSIGLEWME